MDEFEFLGRLKRAVKDSPYTQEQLGDIFGVSSGHISQMLSGVKPMYLDRLLKLIELVDFDASIIVPDKYLRREVVLDMINYRDPEAAKRLMDKIVELDAAGKLSAIDAFAAGILSEVAERKKKVG